MIIPKKKHALMDFLMTKCNWKGNQCKSLLWSESERRRYCK